MAQGGGLGMPPLGEDEEDHNNLDQTRNNQPILVTTIRFMAKMIKLINGIQTTADL